MGLVNRLEKRSVFDCALARPMAKGASAMAAVPARIARREIVVSAFFIGYFLRLKFSYVVQAVIVSFQSVCVPSAAVTAFLSEAEEMRQEQGEGGHEGHD